MVSNVTIKSGYSIDFKSKKIAGNLLNILMVLAPSK